MNFRDIENLDAQLKKVTDFAVDGIGYICKNFGPRPCGEESETKAQGYMKELLEKNADTVTRETFDVHPDAFMSFVPIAGAALLASSALNAVSAFKKKKIANLGSAALTGAAVAAMIGEFGLYKKPLDPLFKKKESGNVIAVRKASGETKRRIIIGGHTDSAPEWTYTYKLGSKGVVSVVGYAVAGLAGNIATTAVTAFSKNEKLGKKMALSQLAFVPAYSALFAFTNGKRYVEGATDNLTGCFTAQAVMKFLADNDIRFENTEVIALNAGGEECGLRGSKAFFAAHPEFAVDGVETMFISVDSIRDDDYMTIYNKDLNGLVKMDADACALMQNAAAKCGKYVPMTSIPLGSCDGAAGQQAGIPSVSFCATDPAPARYYHTRLDTFENLLPDTIQKGIEITLQTIFDFDEKGLK